MPRGLRALRHRDFRLFASGQLVSLVGTWMQRVGQSWLVLELTDSPFKLGLIGTLQFGPMLCFAFLAGAIADRVPKRRMILGTQTALMLQAFVLCLLAWSGHVRYWHVAALAVLYGIAQTLDIPTRQSFVVEMVGKEDLASAIALNSAGFNTARMLGPAAAGLLVDWYGVAPAFALNGLSFLAVILALLAIRAEGLPRRDSITTVRQDIVAGLRYAAGTPQVALMLSLLLAVSLFVINHNVLVPLLARHVLQGGAHEFGLLMTALGIGALLGALSLTFFGRSRPPLSFLIGAALVCSAGTLALGAVRHFGLAFLLLGVVGFAQIVFTATTNTTIQLIVPDNLRGRVMSLHAFVFAGVTPIGSFLMGSLAELFGTSVAYAVGGALGLSSVLGLARFAARKSGGGPAGAPGA
jgi:MFS family permease